MLHRCNPQQKDCDHGKSALDTTRRAKGRGGSISYAIYLINIIII